MELVQQRVAQKVAVVEIEIDQKARYWAKKGRDNGNIVEVYFEQCHSKIKYLLISSSSYV